MTEKKLSPRDDEYLNISEFVLIVWQGRLKILIITILFALSGVLISLLLPNVYKSYAVLAPAADNDTASGLSALTGQFSGLASFAGINLNANKGGDKVQLAIEIMKSRQFASEFINSHELLADLMAAESWDSASNQVLYNEKLYDKETQKWVRKAEWPLKSKPSMQEAYKEYTKTVSINVSEETGMITLSVEHFSPYVAEKWVRWLVQDINKKMKQRDLSSSVNNIEYLKKQIEQTNVADMRAILYKLIEEQSKTIMFSEVRDEYVFRTIDPAVIPEEKFKPKRALICIFMTLIGGVVGVALVFLNYILRRGSSVSPRHFEVK